jgi:hypothetical protein
LIASFEVRISICGTGDGRRAPAGVNGRTWVVHWHLLRQLLRPGRLTGSIVSFEARISICGTGDVVAQRGVPGRTWAIHSHLHRRRFAGDRIALIVSIAGKATIYGTSGGMVQPGIKRTSVGSRSKRTASQFGFPKSLERLGEQHAQMILQEFEGGLICVFQKGIQDQSYAHR